MFGKSCAPHRPTCAAPGSARCERMPNETAAVACYLVTIGIPRAAQCSLRLGTLNVAAGVGPYRPHVAMISSNDEQPVAAAGGDRTSHRVKIVSFLAQTVLPVDLVRQRVPREATHRNTRGAKIQGILYRACYCAANARNPIGCRDVEQRPVEECAAPWRY